MSLVLLCCLFEKSVLFVLQEEGLLLEPKSGLVSDLQMNCPGRHVLTKQGTWEGAPEWRAAG